MYTLKSILMLGLLANALFAIDTPCVPHRGSPLPWEGSGACTGNNQIIIPLDTANLSLVYNSIDGNETYGFGAAAWRLSIDHRLIDLRSTANPKMILDEGDGTKTDFFSQSSTVYAANPILSKSSLNFEASQWHEKKVDGSVLTFSFFSGNLWAVTAITDSKGRITTIQRNATGQIRRITNAFGKQVVVDYALGRASFITDLLNKRTDLSYVALNVPGVGVQNFLSEIALANGTGWVVSHQKLGVPISSNVLSIISPENESQEYTYHNAAVRGIINSKNYPSDDLYVSSQYTASSVTILTRQEKFVEHFNQGKLTLSLENNINTEYVRRTDGLPSMITNSIGQATVYNYDANKNLIYVRGSDGVETLTSYGSTVALKYKPKIVIVQRGATIKSTTLNYDAANKLNEIFTAYNNTSNLFDIITLDSKENILNVRKNGLLSRTYTYDAMSLLDTTTDGLTGLVTRYTYDSFGDLKTVTDPLGQVTTYTRNKLGLPLTVSFPDGRDQTYNYDEIGLVILDRVDGNSGKYYEEVTTRSIILASLKLENLGKRKQTIEASFNIVPLLSKIFPWNQAHAASFTGSSEVTRPSPGGSFATTFFPNGPSSLPGGPSGSSSSQDSGNNSKFQTCGTSPPLDNEICYYDYWGGDENDDPDAKNTVTGEHCVYTVIEDSKLDSDVQYPRAKGSPIRRPTSNECPGSDFVPFVVEGCVWKYRGS